MFDILKKSTGEEIGDEEREERYLYYLRKINGENLRALRKTDFFYSANNVIAFFTSILVLFASAFWMVQAALGLKPETTTLYFTGIGLQAAGALFEFFAAMFGKKRKSPFYSIVKTTYLLLLWIGIVMVATDVIRSGHTGHLYLLYLYFLIICLIPSPNKGASVFICVSMVFGLLLPRLVTGTEGAPEILLAIVFITAYIAYSFLLTRMVRLENSLELSSVTDSITNTLNRRSLDNYLSVVRHDVRYREMSGIMFTVDEFRRYNEVYSHAEGDKLLRQVSGIVYACLEKEKDYIFRYGGMEFIILTPDVSENDLLRKCRKILKAVNDEKIRRNDLEKNPFVSVTLGAAVTDKEEDIISELDREMLLAQRVGRARMAMNGKIYE